MFDLFHQLFSPGRRHTQEERNRLDLTRDEAGDTDPGKGPIDLDSGRVTIRLPSPGAREHPTTP